VADKRSNPKKTDTVSVSAASGPVRHDGVLYEIGEKIEMVFRDAEHLIEAGVVKLEGIVTGKSGGGKGAGKKTDGDGSGSGQGGEKS